MARGWRRSDSTTSLVVARRRFARRQRARRWLAWRRLVAAALALALVVGSAWLVFFSSVLAVAEVSVAGTDVLAPGEVRRVAAVPVGEPLATVDLESVSQRLESLAAVQSVDVTRTWPDGVRIAVTERSAVAALETDDGLRGVDAAGVVFRSYPAAPRGLPVLRLSAGGRADALTEAAAVLGVLPNELAARVESVDVDSIDNIALRLRDGRTLWWGSAEESATKAAVAAVLLRQKATSYDVSVPGQPTLRP